MIRFWKTDENRSKPIQQKCFVHILIVAVYLLDMLEVF
jgi:hypothetical protein